MLKLLITGLIIYFIYQYFIASPALNRSSTDDPARIDEEDGDYIDYEEVD